MQWRKQSRLPEILLSSHRFRQYVYYFPSKCRGFFGRLTQLPIYPVTNPVNTCTHNPSANEPMLMFSNITGICQISTIIALGLLVAALLLLLSNDRINSVRPSRLQLSRCRTTLCCMARVTAASARSRPLYQRPWTIASRLLPLGRVQVKALAKTAVVRAL